MVMHTMPRATPNARQNGSRSQAARVKERGDGPLRLLSKQLVVQLLRLGRRADVHLHAAGLKLSHLGQRVCLQLMDWKDMGPGGLAIHMAAGSE